MFKKNTAVVGFGIGHFINASTGAAVTTGTPTCKRTLDGTGGDCANAAAYNTNGAVWAINLEAGDLNGDVVVFSFTLTDCLPISYTLRTTTKLVSDLHDATALTDYQQRSVAVTLPIGTGTGQINLSGGVVPANLMQINATAILGTSTQIAAAFVEFFNVATPTGTINTVVKRGDVLQDGEIMAP